MKTSKRAKGTETHLMESGKYVNVLIILNAMVRRFRETLVLIKEEQAKTGVFGTTTVGQVNDTASRRSV